MLTAVLVFIVFALVSSMGAYAASKGDDVAYTITSLVVAIAPAPPPESEPKGAGLADGNASPASSSSPDEEGA